MISGGNRYPVETGHRQSPCPSSVIGLPDGANCKKNNGPLPLSGKIECKTTANVALPRTKFFTDDLFDSRIFAIPVPSHDPIAHQSGASESYRVAFAAGSLLCSLMLKVQRRSPERMCSTRSMRTCSPKAA
jgi:hypothetical protein